MRKSVIPVSILFALVSCGKSTSIDSLKEISIGAVRCVETKGYVTDDALVESGTPRDIHLSAYDSSSSQPYFLNETFRSPAGTISWTNYRGEVHTPLYWPQNTSLNFLAYSTGSVSPNAVWSVVGKNPQAVLNVTPESLQDDILFAVSNDCTAESSPVSLEFEHTQAWLEFIVKAPLAEITNFKGVTIENIYTSGDLTIADNYGTPYFSWDFSRTSRTNYMLAPDWTAYSTSEPQISLSVLIPQQLRNSFKFHFDINGSEKIYECELPGSGYWYSSMRYTYMVNVIGGEITPVSKSDNDAINDFDCEFTMSENSWN